MTIADGQTPTVWGRATPAAQLRVYRWLRRGNRVGASLGTIAGGVLAIGGHGVGLGVCGVLMVFLLPLFLVELSLRPRGGDKPVIVRQAAADRKAAVHSHEIFRRGSAHPRRTGYIAPADASPGPFAAHADIVYQRSCSEIRWEDNALKITDWLGRMHIWSVSSGGVESDFLPPKMGSPKTVTTAPPDTPAVVAFALLKPASRPIDLLVLLDRRSRQVGAVPVRGFTESAITDVARKAGVELSVYELPSRFGHSQEAVAAALFPRSVL